MTLKKTKLDYEFWEKELQWKEGLTILSSLSLKIEKVTKKKQLIQLEM